MDLYDIADREVYDNRVKERVHVGRSFAGKREVAVSG
jgi:hypothetical protein